MNLEIVTKNIDGENAVRNYINDKINAAFDRFEHRIDDITVRLSDENTSSRAFDGLCKIEVVLIPRQSIHVDATGSSPFECVGQAIEKMVAAIRHEFDRARSSANIRHQQSRMAE